jgi:hypothetical protein
MVRRTPPLKGAMMNSLGLYLTILGAALITGGQATNKPAIQGEQVRRVCYASFPVHLGDSFEEVSRNYKIRRDPNKSSGNPDWAAGRTTDFLWLGPDHKLPDGTVLRPSVFLTFSDRKRLRKVSINWHYDGDCGPTRLDALVEFVKTQLHPCLKGSLVERTAREYRGRIDYGTYSEELSIKINPEARCGITYHIQEQP